MNIYLDIDGVLIDRNHRPAEGLGEFLVACSKQGTMHWLTTWCKQGDAAPALRRLRECGVNEDTIELMAQQCNATTWTQAKTEAIDFSQPFLWFDDDCYADERAALEQHGVLGNWVQVDLVRNPQQLAEMAQGFPLPLTNID